MGSSDYSSSDGRSEISDDDDDDSSALYGGPDDRTRLAQNFTLTPLRYEGNSMRYGDIVGLVDQSEVHVDVSSMLVFSGGTAFKGVVEELKKLTTLGGSTAEIVRALGGLAVGDIQSRCLERSSGRNLSSTGSTFLYGV